MILAVRVESVDEQTLKSLKTHIRMEEERKEEENW